MTVTKRTGCEHGVHPVKDCNECEADKRRQRRLANLRPNRPTGCSPHGVQPASSCRECGRERVRKWRRANGVQPASKGCKKHGNPRGCKECSRERSERYNRRHGVQPRVVNYCDHGVPLKYRATCTACRWQKPEKRRLGCKKHGIPYHLCIECKRKRDQKYTARLRRIRAEESARLAVQAAEEAELVGRPDAETRLLERALRDIAHGTEAQNALNALNDALLSTVTPCKDEPKFTEPGWTRVEAAEACGDCPLAVQALCLAYGKAAKADYRRKGYRLEGVYGGTRVEDLR